MTDARTFYTNYPTTLLSKCKINGKSEKKEWKKKSEMQDNTFLSAKISF